MHLSISTELSLALKKILNFKTLHIFKTNAALIGVQ